MRENVNWGKKKENDIFEFLEKELNKVLQSIDVEEVQITCEEDVLHEASALVGVDNPINPQGTESHRV